MPAVTSLMLNNENNSLVAVIDGETFIPFLYRSDQSAVTPFQVVELFRTGEFSADMFIKVTPEDCNNFRNYTDITYTIADIT